MHLKHSKNSIIALYISGVISLSKQLVDDANLIILINIFSDNRKWQIVEYLCQRILEFGEPPLTNSYIIGEVLRVHMKDEIFRIEGKRAEEVRQGQYGPTEEPENNPAEIHVLDEEEYAEQGEKERNQLDFIMH